MSDVRMRKVENGVKVIGTKKEGEKEKKEVCKGRVNKAKNRGSNESDRACV